MADYGPALMGISRYGGSAILHHMQNQVSYVFTIKKKEDANGKTVWRCSGCNTLKNRDNQHPPVPLLSVENGRLKSDPENPNNAHYCAPIPSAEVKAYQAYVKCREEVKKTGKRPRAAFAGALASVARNYGHDAQERDAIENQMPELKRVRSSLYLAYNSRYPVIHGVPDIPDHLKMTLEGASSTDQADPKYHEVYLIHNEPNPPLLIFASRQDVEIMHRSEHIIIDGTFAYRPQDIQCAQIYIVMGFVNGEALPVAHALLPNRNQQTYETFFGALRNALIQRFGNVGTIRYAHFDFEDAAINGFSAVFPGIQVKGCVFHYSQALTKNVQEKGLASVYNRSPVHGYDAPQYAAVRTWVRRIVALALLDPGYVTTFWARVLQNPPNTADPIVDANTARFATYVFRQWLRTPEKVRLMNHYDHDGPRTSNHVEGYNNSLRSKFQRTHPRLAIFLVEFQEQHHEIQIRGRQLLNGAAPVARIRRYAENDARITLAKQAFRANTEAIDRADPNFAANVDAEIITYLDHVQNLLAS